MHEKAKFVCFIHMQPQRMKFKSVQINMKQVSYVCLLSIPGSKPQDNVKSFLSQFFAGISSKKESWLMRTIGQPVGLYCAKRRIYTE